MNAPAMAGLIIGGLFVTFLTGRLGKWAFKRLGDNEERLMAGYAAAYVLSIVVGGLGFADGGPPKFAYSAFVYAVPILFWLTVDLLALRKRRAKGL